MNSLPNPGSKPIHLNTKASVEKQILILNKSLEFLWNKVNTIQKDLNNDVYNLEQKIEKIRVVLNNNSIL